MEEVTNRQIIAYARSCRTPISAAQLSRWRELGLLGPYRRRGRGRGKGQTVYYWAGAPRLAVRIVRDLRTERDLLAVGWRLWLLGYPVPGIARRVLLRTVDGLEHEEERARANAALPPHRRKRAWTLTTSADRQMAAVGYRMIRGLPAEYSLLNFLAVKAGKPLGRNPARLSAAVKENLELAAQANAGRMREAIHRCTDVDLAKARDMLVIVMLVAAREILPVKPLDRSPACVPPPFMLFYVMGLQVCTENDHTVCDGFHDAVLQHTRMSGHGGPIPPKYVDQMIALRQIRMEVRRARRKLKLL